ncbi:TonB-dependent receptor [Iodobacter fluviatilis]|uniref:Iron complex outermembrane receptor protein n=1 Tax=Iodobacter fluviatilis TaxID=537 RepID=A0A377Q4B2_9NEIS|nr:TonB-dependent receptor [Iodobacter fluviatilis]TCU90402.1 iron complex outermembrane receptor protein [Iodobacter fluviatilis]STQ89429.1 Outer membrane cobalamin translocator [Iodobacter fluviatilis]
MHFRPKLLAIVIAQITASTLAYAADLPTNKVERVEVVGSNIKRINKEGPSPVTIIKRDEIEKSGATTVVEALDNLLPKASLEFATDGGRFAPGSSTVGLRGMGAKNTLILLNGRRLAPNGFADVDTSPVSLNNIPLSAIEQIEVLYDGAAAIYGSDAVAGVINFKTKRNFQGVSITGKYGQNFAGDGQDLVLGIAAGFGNLNEDNQNLLVTLDVTEKKPTLDNKHDATKNLDKRGLGGADNRFTGLHGGAYKIKGGTTTLLPGCEGNGEIVTDPFGNQKCFSNENLYRSAHIKRLNANALYNYQISDDALLFAELGIGQDRQAFESWPLSIPAAQAVIKAGDAAYKDVINGVKTNGKDITITRRIYEAGLAQNNVDSDTLRAVLGAKASLGGWDGETALTYSSNKSSQARDRADAAKITAAFKKGGYDPFVANNQVELAKALITSRYREGTASLLIGDARVSHSSLFQLAGGDVGFAAGVNILKEKAVEDSTVESSRWVKSIYGELNIPVLKNLEIQAALRYDHYDDVGGATSPKVAVAYRPVESLLLRGSATSTFRAPSLQQLGMSPTPSYYFYNDWARCKPMGVPNGECIGRVDLNSRSNPELKPETSNNLTLGFVFQPLKDLSLSIDWYSIKQNDAIARLDPQYVIDHEDSNPAMGKLIKRLALDPDELKNYPGLTKGKIEVVDLPLANIGQIDTSGIDVDFNFAYKTNGWGKFTFRDQFSYLLSYKRSDLEGTDPVERTGGYNNPDWSNRISLGYQYAEYDATLTAKTYARVHDAADLPENSSNPDGYLPSYTVFNLSAGYQLNKNTSFVLGVNNLFDKVAPYSVDGGGYNGTTSGRYGFIGFDYKL